MFPDLGSQYKFIKELGSGGAGVVNLAIDTHSGFPVAIKSLYNRHLNNANVLNKFQTEANIYLMLEHPNIVSLKNFIIKNGNPHLVQEYFEGKTLDEYIKYVTGPIPSVQALRIMKKIISAIDYAHNKKIPIPGYDGVLHLDIKPGNVLISSFESVKIIDYGISQGSGQSRGDKIMGSPMYMAPEQLDVNKKIDKRTDIYALGLLMHQMITGSAPYSSNTTKEKLFDDINNKPLVRSFDIYPGVDKRIQIIIDKATQKIPVNRYQSCNEFIEAIDKIIDK